MNIIKRFIDCKIPLQTCTLRCHYCYVTHNKLFENKIPVFKYDANFIGNALTQKRLGGICMFNLCADGETLLSSQVVEYIRAILEQGHFVMVVTNGTMTKRFDEIIKFPAHLLSHLFFKFSYHYLELKKRGLIELFFLNIEKVRNAGCSFTLEVTPSDELIPYIDEVKKTSLENVGALCHLTVARNDRISSMPILTKLSREDYKKTWEVFDSELFNFKLSVFGEKRKEFCYAGDWSVCLDLGTGILRQCYCSASSQNIFDDIEKPIKFRAIGKCREAHCHNAHAFLCFGDIPDMNSPLYSQVRNRVCVDGREWLSSDMKDAMSHKLLEKNRLYTLQERKIAILYRYLYLALKFPKKVFSLIYR